MMSFLSHRGLEAVPAAKAPKPEPLEEDEIPGLEIPTTVSGPLQTEGSPLNVRSVPGKGAIPTGNKFSNSPTGLLHM
jgi:hypothetical protein